MIETTLGELSIGGGSYGIGAPAVDYSPNYPTYLRITDIRDDGTLNASSMKSVADPKASQYILKENDIVFARTGNSTGRNYFYDARDGELAYAGFLIKFSIDPKRVNPRYIKYYVQSDKYLNWVSSHSTGSTRGNINAKTFASMPIDLPTRDAQNAAVAVLDTLSNEIRINQQINGYLEELAKSRFNKLTQEDPHTFRLDDLVEFEDSKRIPLNSRARAARRGRYPYYGATGIMDYVDDYLFDGTRVLVGEDGSVVTDTGHPIVQYVWGKFWVNNHAHVLKASAEYSLEAIDIALENTTVTELITGAVQLKISQRNLRNLKIELPSPESIDCLKPIFRMYKALTEENEHLSALREALLPKLMTGEIDVSGIELPTQPNSHLYEN